MLTRGAQELSDTLCANFVGPLTRPRQENTVLLVFFDLFSKWVEHVALAKGYYRAPLSEKESSVTS